MLILCFKGTICPLTNISRHTLASVTSLSFVKYLRFTGLKATNEWQDYETGILHQVTQQKAS